MRLHGHALPLAFLGLFAAGAPFALRAPTPPGLERPAGGLLALVDANLIDGTGADARPGCTILIDGERIAAVGEDVEVPEGAEVLDLGGASVLPGLIDMHGHLSLYLGSREDTVAAPYARLYLAGGVTTVFSPGDFDPEEVLAFRDAQREGRETGTRVYCAGPFFDHGDAVEADMLRMDDPEDAVRDLRPWLDKIDGIKVYTGVTDEILEAVVQEADRVGLTVTGHLGAVTATRAAEVGIDRLEHGIFAMSEFGTPDPANTFDLDYLYGIVEADLESGAGAEMIDTLVENGVVLDPTVVVLDHLFRGEELGDWERYAAEEALPGIRGLRDALAGMRARAADDPLELELAVEGFLDKQLELVRLVHERGGRVVGGTDPVFLPVLPGIGMQREAELFVEAGMTELEAIRACSLSAAESLGLEGDLGSVEPGKLADLVVVDGDPSRNIGDLRNTRTVYQAGARYSPEALREATAGKIR